mmetsp:Transcript_113969/g.329195  ORF Transcript_113969/g.329195 Transcript_113969/m.329195 type:complete len:271 (-) Transcript_113969:389-1201(-)
MPRIRSRTWSTRWRKRSRSARRRKPVPQSSVRRSRPFRRSAPPRRRSRTRPPTRSQRPRRSRRPCACPVRRPWRAAAAARGRSSTCRILSGAAGTARSWPSSKSWSRRTSASSSSRDRRAWTRPSLRQAPSSTERASPTRTRRRHSPPPSARRTPIRSSPWWRSCISTRGPTRSAPRFARHSRPSPSPMTTTAGASSRPGASRPLWACCSASASRTARSCDRRWTRCGISHSTMRPSTGRRTPAPRSSWAKSCARTSTLRHCRPPPARCC